MKELAVGLFKADFKWELIQLEGFIFIALLGLWISCFWNQILDKFATSTSDRLWFWVCCFAGLFLTVTAAYNWGPEYGLIAFAIGASIAFALYNSSIAIFLLVALLFLRPWELLEKDDFFALLPKLSFAICAGHAFQALAKRKNLMPHWDRVMTLVIAFAAWAFLTTFRSGNPIASQHAYFETLFKAVLLYVLVVNTLREELELTVFLRTLTLVFVAVGLISIYQTIHLMEASMDPEFRLLGIGAFSNSNDIAALMVLVFPFGLFQAYRKSEPILIRVLGGTLMIIVAWSIYLSQSRGAMLAILAIVSLFMLLKIRNKTLTTIVVAGSIALVPAYMAFSSRAESDLEASSSSRMVYIKTGLVMALKNPVFGVGYERYEESFERYATSFEHEWGQRTAHNSWVLVFAETGLLGLILYLALFQASFKQAWAIFGKAPEFLLSLAGYGIAITFLSHSYLLYPYLLIGLTSVAYRIHSA